ncbi:MAG: ABC transporter ATP-binding protein [FCB group bacterium]|nr:ABC transporter ATP-binding protein [FCB group bacterium]
MIQVENLYKELGSKPVLKGLSFEVNDGETFVVIGKSGSGKSVLLKHLIGLLKADSGKVMIDGENIGALSFKELQRVRQKIGMVFQSGALFDSMSVGENIALALRSKEEFTKWEIKEKVKEALEIVDLAEAADLMPSELSGGMKKRAGFARAIALDPQYMLYDEPTTGLDPVMTDMINRLMLKFKQQKEITSVIVTHELRIVHDVADRVLLLNEGEVAFNGLPAEIEKSEDPVVRQFMTGDSTLAIGEKI